MTDYSRNELLSSFLGLSIFVLFFFSPSLRLFLITISSSTFHVHLSLDFHNQHTSLRCPNGRDGSCAKRRCHLSSQLANTCSSDQREPITCSSMWPWGVSWACTFLDNGAFTWPYLFSKEQQDRTNLRTKILQSSDLFTMWFCPRAAYYSLPLLCTSQTGH